MEKEEFILNELGIKVANLTIEVAALKAQLNEAYKKINEYENQEEESKDETKND